MHLAAAYGKEASIEFLVNPDTFKLWEKHIKAKGGNPQEKPVDLDLYAVDELGRTTLHHAVHHQRYDVIKKLVQLDKKLCPKGTFVTGHTKFNVLKGATSLLNIGDKDGVTPLMYSVVTTTEDPKNQTVATKLLLDARADCSLTDKTRGWSAVHHVAASGIEESLKVLLEHADTKLLNMPSKGFKQTPLMVASYYGNAKIVSLLLSSKKVDLKLRDASGDFALHHAVKQEQSDIVEILLPEKTPKKEITVFTEENGVGLTALDCAMLKMTSIFHSARNSTAQQRHNRFAVSSVHTVVPAHLQKLYKHMNEVVGHARRITPSNDVRNVTEIIIAQSVAERDRLKKEAFKNPRNRRGNYDEDDNSCDEDEDDDDDEDRVNVQGEMHPQWTPPNPIQVAKLQDN